MTDEDDRQENPIGEYYFSANSEDEALDEFHSTVPIACLDDFNIEAMEVKRDMGA